MVIHSHQKSKRAFINCAGRPVRGVYHTIIAFVLAAMVGCAPAGPDYIRPEVSTPTRWNSLCADGQKRSAQPSVAWWQTFNDPVLIDLVELARTENLDIKEALSRVREARMRRFKNRASLFPSLDAAASARQSASSGESGSEQISELYSAGFDAGWELDLFGGLRRSAEAYQADLEAQIEDLHDVVVTLLAEVAVNYIDVRTYQARLSVAQRNVSTQQETWELLVALVRAGSGDELAVAQARYNLESSKAKITDLNVGLEAALNRLSLLTGKAAGALPAGLSEIHPIPVVSIDPAVGIPADVIRQRPDIRQAERELAAQTARIGVAEADLYPSLTLSGSIGRPCRRTG
ncbi:MAG: efflux transporter outer membrane subunit [Desulfobacteraceae bacterium]|jgi:NodT family efflux transporter outer membrane factor (OMF) lipoprotein